MTTAAPRRKDWMRSVWRRHLPTRRSWSRTRGYHGRAGLKMLADGPWTTRIAEPHSRGVLRWQGDSEARRAVYNNRKRLGSGIGRAARRLRAERVERSFEHTLDRGGMRRTHLRRVPAWLRCGLVAVGIATLLDLRARGQGSSPASR